MKTHHKPLGCSIRIPVVIIAMAAAVFVPTEGHAYDDAVFDECNAAWKRCINQCNIDYILRDARQDCHARCSEKTQICLNIEMESSKKSSDTGSTPVPPTKVQRDPVPVGPITQPGVVPKTKIGENVGKTGGVKKDPMNVRPTKQPVTGTSATPTTKIGEKVGKVGGVKKDPMNVSPTKQHVTGSGAVPKTKIGENVGKVGGVKKVQEGWKTPSTSGGGTILMQRSKGKKN